MRTDLKKGMTVKYKWWAKGSDDQDEEHTGKILNIRKNCGEDVVIILGHASKPLVFTGEHIDKLEVINNG